MPFSTTYLSAIVIILAQVLAWLGIEVGSEELTQVLTTLITIASGLYIAWRRYSRGDISIGGFKS